MLKAQGFKFDVTFATIGSNLKSRLYITCTHCTRQK
jgi:hypothetical protein